MKPFLGVATSVWLVAAGMAFTVRCEFGPPLPGGWSTCWLIGGAVAGVPFAKRLAEKSGFVDGYNTWNPALRKPRQDDEAA